MQIACDIISSGAALVHHLGTNDRKHEEERMAYAEYCESTRVPAYFRGNVERPIPSLRTKPPLEVTQVLDLWRVIKEPQLRRIDTASTAAGAEQALTTQKWS